MAEPIRVLLVDHQPLLRRCLAAVLNRRRGLLVVGEAESGGQACRQVLALQPDVIVIEPELPEGGDALLAELQQTVPGVSLLVLTSGLTDVSRRALAAGARGCIQKDCGLMMSQGRSSASTPGNWSWLRRSWRVWCRWRPIQIRPRRRTD